jgi:hypothetical protein
MFTTLRITRRPSAFSRFAVSRSQPEYARRQPERRHRVNVQHRLVLLVGHLLDHVVPRVARVVDQNVESAELRDRRVDQLLRKLRPGQIPRQRGAAGHQRGRLFKNIGVEIVHENARPRRGQRNRDRAADAAPRAGDQRGSAS